MRCLLSILVALGLAGCAEAPAPIAAAPAPAPQRPAAWQQFCEQAWNVQHASSLAAARGNEGWELVAMYNGVLCYKRPLGEAPSYRPQIAPSSAPPSSTAIPMVRDPGF
ncbi:MAG: hypothetical protein QM820_37420 [Minicystis sp.]